MNFHTDGDAAADRLERRWFAAFKAASAARSECEDHLEAMAVAQAAWNDARARLAELEVLRDALGLELAQLDAQREEIARGGVRLEESVV